MGNAWLLLPLGVIACGGVAIERSEGAGEESGPRDADRSAIPGAHGGGGSGADSKDTGSGMPGGSLGRELGPFPGYVPSYGTGGSSAGTGGGWGGKSGGWAGATGGWGGQSGGWAGAAGSSGAPTINECLSTPLGSLADWVPRERDLSASVGHELAAARNTLTGSWRGVVTTPWVDAYSVTITFSVSGSYSAHCLENSDYAGGNGCCRAFYYGSDRDSSLKRWSLTSLNENGSAAGDIEIAFCYDQAECYQPGWQGKLRELAYDATGNRLRFEFWTDEGYGPVAMDLERD